MPARDIAATFWWWIGVRAVFHRGYWLVTSLYLVVEAELSAFQLVFLGTAQGLTALVAEVPTGVLADTISRKASLVVAHLVTAAGMVATGLVTDFSALVATQMAWGFGWTFASGADVAWLTDELAEPERTARVLTAGARWEQVGAAVGLLGFGALAWASDLATAIVVSGLAMAALGLFVAARFPERGFTPARVRRWRASREIFVKGLSLARHDRQIRIVFAATLLVNGAAEAFDRLFPKRLIELGLPEAPDPIVWLSALGLVTLALAALTLRIVEARIDGVGAARRSYLIACAIGALGLLVFAQAPDATTAMAGVLVVGGITWTVTRTVGVIWVNRRASSEVRATLQSFLAQMEYSGEILPGLSLGVVAQTSGIPVAILGSCALVTCAGALTLRARGDVGQPTPKAP